MMLLSSIMLSVSADAVKGEFALSQGESAIFVLAYGEERSANLERYHTREKLQLTRRYWQDLVAGMHYGGLWREQVVRSFLVLHLMMYRGTGAIVAAPTTSPAGDARRVAELGLPLLMAARHELHRRRPLPAWRCVRSGPLHPLAAGAVSVESPPSTYPLRDHAVVVTRGTDPRSPAWLRGFPTGAHWQCRRRPPAVGRIRRSHCVDPLAAGVARRDI